MSDDENGKRGTLEDWAQIVFFPVFVAGMCITLVATQLTAYAGLSVAHCYMIVVPCLAVIALVWRLATRSEDALNGTFLSMTRDDHLAILGTVAIIGAIITASITAIGAFTGSITPVHGGLVIVGALIVCAGAFHVVMKATGRLKAEVMLTLAGEGA